MRELTLNAYAKINLTLDILRCRPDSYHDLRMVMQTVSLHDLVTVRADTGTGDIAVRTGLAELPDGSDNLAWKAARAFFDATGLANSGLEIVIEKRIPICAGLAGGSADGAAVLKALKQMLLPKLPEERLENIGAQVGSDVPFCIRGGTALAEGRGELLTALPPMPNCLIVLCKPEFGISTPELFQRVRVEELPFHPDTEGVRKALAAGTLETVAQLTSNVFESVLLQEKNEIAAIERAMRDRGALGAAMTGSGPTVFGIFDNQEKACAVVELLRSHYAQTYLTEPV